MQITDDLVNKITAELMKRLGAEPEAPASESACGFPGAGSGGSRPRALVMGPEGSFSQALAAALRSSLELEFKLPEFSNLSDLAAYKVFILTRMSCTGLVQLALGFDEGCTWEARLALAGLMNGAKVFVLEEGLAWRAYQTAAPKGLTRHYADSEKTAQAYGLRLIPEADLPGAIQALRWDSAPPAPAGSWPKAAMIPNLSEPADTLRPVNTKKLLTESDAVELCRDGAASITVAVGTIITPLAQDYLKVHKVTVVKG